MRALGGGDAIGIHGERPTRGCGGQGTRGAHLEHLAHVRDLGRVEAERLVEGIRVLPGRNAGMQCGTRYGPGGVRALGVAVTQSACTEKAPTQGCEGQDTRGAHVEHGDHGRDLGRVEAEQLVERRRALPSRKAGMRRGKRYSPGGGRALGGGDTQAACTGRARLKAGGPGHARSARRTCGTSP